MFERFSIHLLLLSAVSGLYLVSYLPYLPSISFVLVINLVLIIAVLFLNAVSGRRFSIARQFLYFMWYLLAFALGFCYGAVYGHSLIDKQWPQVMDNQGFLIEGHVIGLPQMDESSQRFHFLITDIAGLDTTVSIEQKTQLMNKKIRLSWRKKSFDHDLARRIKSGDRWRLSVKLRRPRGFVNPSGFDYQLYLLQQGVMASGYVRKSKHNQFMGNDCAWYSHHCWREKLAQYLKEQRHQGIMTGLLVGDRQFISSEQWELLKKTGTIHLLAISGLHIGLAATMGMIFGRCLSRVLQLLVFFRLSTSYRLFFYLPSAFSILFAFTYSLLAGFSLPTQRAMVMVFLFHLGLISYRKIKPLSLFIFALLIIGLLDPLSVQTPGFWLSFGAVGVLLFSFIGYQRRSITAALNEGEHHYLFFQRRLLSPLFSLCKSQYVVFIGLFLPSLLLLKGLSFAAPLANLIAIPLVSIFTVPLLLAAFLLMPLSDIIHENLLSAVNFSIDVLLVYLDWVINIVDGFWQHSFSDFSLLDLGLALLGFLCLLLPHGFFRYRLIQYGLALGLCSALFFDNSVKPIFKMTFMDLGQGTGVVVQTTYHQLVYDTGKHYSERFDSGKHLIAPYLISEGHKGIDTLIISHADNDHAGGSEGLQSQIRVGHILSGQPDKSGGRQCLAGQVWQWDELRVEVLWPDSAFLATAGSTVKNNDFSCVLLLNIADKRILLTGDIEKQTEKFLLKRYAEVLQDLDLILVPHHGSAGASHAEWVARLRPKYAVITAGYHNAYGHPHPDVLERYSSIGSVVLNTGRVGAVDVAINSIERASLDVRAWRKVRPRYWYDNIGRAAGFSD